MFFHFGRRGNMLAAMAVLILGFAITFGITQIIDTKSNVVSEFANVQIIEPREFSDYASNTPVALYGLVINDGEWAAWNHEFESCTTRFKKQDSGAIKTYQDCTWRRMNSYWGDIIVTDTTQKFRVSITEWDRNFYGAWDKTEYNDAGVLQRISGIKVQQDILAIGTKDNGKFKPRMVCLVYTANPVQECLERAEFSYTSGTWLAVIIGTILTLFVAFMVHN